MRGSIALGKFGTDHVCYVKLLNKAKDESRIKSKSWCARRDWKQILHIRKDLPLPTLPSSFNIKIPLIAHLLLRSRNERMKDCLLVVTVRHGETDTESLNISKSSPQPIHWISSLTHINMHTCTLMYKYAHIYTKQMYFLIKPTLPGGIFSIV